MLCIGLRHIGLQVLLIFRSYMCHRRSNLQALSTTNVVLAHIRPEVHTSPQGYTHHVRGTHITPGVHTSCQGYTHHVRGTHITSGVHTSRQGYTHHVRGTHIMSGVHTSCQGYTHHARGTHITPGYTHQVAKIIQGRECKDSSAVCNSPGSAITSNP